MSQTFSEFALPSRLLEILTENSFVSPTPVQALSIPLVLASRDVLACAQTGTGKTLAFAVPLLARMIEGNENNVVVLAPTRELADQIFGVLEQLTLKMRRLRPALIIGGASMFAQEKALRFNPRFIIATPGRLNDHLKRGHFKLDRCSTVVLDEADRMLDMGFEPQLRSIFKALPQKRQTLLFSATLPKEILKIAHTYMQNPEQVRVGEPSTPATKIKQRLIQTSVHEKAQTLIRELDQVSGSILVFTRTKSRTESVAKLLQKAGHAVSRIHGDRSQFQRREAISKFRDGQSRILVATDIAARGLDIPHIEHVVNYDLPMCAEDYVHRIGRTARNGRDGQALCFVTPEDTRQWDRIHKMMYGKSSEKNSRPAGRPSQNRFQKPSPRFRSSEPRRASAFSRA